LPTNLPEKLPAGIRLVEATRDHGLRRLLPDFGRKASTVPGYVLRAVDNREGHEGCRDPPKHLLSPNRAGRLAALLERSVLKIGQIL
jgi:hypothetical protein